MRQQTLFLHHYSRRIINNSRATTTPNAPFYMPSVQPSFGDPDRRALNKLWVASITFLALYVAGYAIDFILNPFRALVLVTPPASGSTTPTVHFNQNFVTVIIASLVVSGTVELFALFQVRSAFKGLASVDGQRFRVPSLLTLLFIIVVPIALVGVFFYISAFFPLLNSFSQQQASVTTPTIPPSTLGYLIAGGAIGGIAGIIALVGLIGGVMLGLWRVGGRYADSLLKVAAILIIIPLLDIVVPILVLLGVRSVRRKIFSPSAPPA